MMCFNVLYNNNNNKENGWLLHKENRIYVYIYKDLFTNKDINTYINGVVEMCLNIFLNI